MDKALLINDIHIANNNIPDFNMNWDEALSVAKKENVDAIIVGGDLFQSRVAQTLGVLIAVREAIVRAINQGLRVIMANGNHDKVDLNSHYGYCHIFNDLYGVEVVDVYKKLEIGDIDMYVVPYFPEKGRLLEIIKEIENEMASDGTRTVLYLHAGINGALGHASDHDLPADMFGKFHKVVSGHYHNRTHIDGSNVHYIGSSRQHNFGEDERKGYTIINGSGDLEYIDNQVNTRYTTIETTFKKHNTPEVIEKLKELRDCGRYKVRLRVTCKQEEAQSIDRKELIEYGASKVEIIVNDIRIINVEQSQIYQKFDRNKLKDTYTSFCEEKGIVDVKTGIEYLSV